METEIGFNEILAKQKIFHVLSIIPPLHSKKGLFDAR
jgi:hypothetical protein